MDARSILGFFSIHSAILCVHWERATTLTNQISD